MNANITRKQNFPSVARPGPAWRWVYSYSINGARPVEYGTGLASLRRMLREKFDVAPASITEDWSAAA